MHKIRHSLGRPLSRWKRNRQSVRAELRYEIHVVRWRMAGMGGATQIHRDGGHFEQGPHALGESKSPRLQQRQGQRPRVGARAARGHGFTPSSGIADGKF